MNYRLVLILVLLFTLRMQAEEITRIEAPFDGFITKQQRTDFAIRLKAFFEALDRKIPTLKPSERDYVEQELKRLQTRGKPPTDLQELINWQRESREFFECREYRVMRVKDGIAFLERQLEEIISEKYRTWSPSTASLEGELYGWAVFSGILLKADFFEHIAQLNQGARWIERDIIIGTHASFTDLTSSGCKSAIGGAISEHIFGSYFNEQIKQKREATRDEDEKRILQELRERMRQQENAERSGEEKKPKT